MTLGLPKHLHVSVRTRWALRSAELTPCTGVLFEKTENKTSRSAIQQCTAFYRKPFPQEPRTELSGAQLNLIRPSYPTETNHTDLSTSLNGNVKSDNQAVVRENLSHIAGL